MDLINKNKLLKSKYVINLSPPIPEHSIRLVLEWNTLVNFDLYGTFSVKNDQCVTSEITKACGGTILD